MDDNPLHVIFDAITIMIVVVFFIGLGAWLAWMFG